MKIKAKSVDFFKSISIPGFPQIVTTEGYFLKAILILLTLLTFALGFKSISLAATDYYKFDVITNIARVTQNNVTFPAITVCTAFHYNRNHYRNRSVVKTDIVEIRTDNISRIKNFLNFAFTGYKLLSVSDHLDSFKTSKLNSRYGEVLFDCLRFNAVTKKRIELLTANTTEDVYFVTLNNFYVEYISENEYFNYSIIQPSSYYVFIGDNFLNSFERTKYLQLDPNKFHLIELVKESIEVKLPEPFNRCKESSVDAPFHQSNCIEACIYREVKEKYNCTFSLTLFAFQDLKKFDIQNRNFHSFRQEFSVGCLMDCPLESCYSEKWTSYVISEINGGPTVFYVSLRDFTSLNITQIPKTDSFTFINNTGVVWVFSWA